MQQPPGPPYQQPYPQQPYPQQPYPQQQYPQQPPPRKGMSGCAIAAIIGGAISILGGGCVALVTLGVLSGAPKASVPTEGKEALASAKSAYVGEWSSSTTKMTIAKDGSLSFKKDKSGMKKEVNGTVKGFSGNDIVVDAFVTITLDVQTPPHEEGGKWKMKVEEEEVERAK